jgi:hypothetical protein
VSDEDSKYPARVERGIDPGLWLVLMPGFPPIETRDRQLADQIFQMAHSAYLRGQCDLKLALRDLVAL